MRQIISFYWLDLRVECMKGIRAQDVFGSSFVDFRAAVPTHKFHESFQKVSRRN